MGKNDCKVQLCEIYRAIKDLWKKIADMVTISLLADPNNNIEEIYVKGKEIGIYDSPYPDTIKTPLEVGGISAGTEMGTLRGSNLTEMMDDILFPTIDPIIKEIKSVLFNPVAIDDYYERGTRIGVEFRAVFDKGLIENGDGSNGPPLVGAADEFIFDGSGLDNPIHDPDGLATASITIKFGNNMWTVNVTHEEGQGVYFDSKGQPSTVLDAERTAGSIDGDSPSIEGITPFFNGMSSADLESGGQPFYQAMEKTVIPKAAHVPLNVFGNNGYIYLAYEARHGSALQIQDGNGFNVTESFDEHHALVESVSLDENYSVECIIYKTKNLTTVDPAQEYKLIF